MSFAVTRAYMRGRLLFIMTGFLLAVALGTAFIHWQAGAARANVKFGSVLGAMSDATADVIYYALMLDQSRLKAELEARAALRPQQPSSDAAAANASARTGLNEAIGRLDRAYSAFALAADGDLQMGESKRITSSETD